MKTVDETVLNLRQFAMAFVTNLREAISFDSRAIGARLSVSPLILS